MDNLCSKCTELKFYHFLYAMNCAVGFGCELLCAAIDFFHEWNKNYSQEGAWELTKDNLVIPEEYLTT